MRLAISQQKRFVHLRHAAPHILLHRGAFQRDPLRWTLVEGDFLSTFADQPQPDVVFYDPFSSKVDHAMWSLATFRRLFDHFERPVELFTYSASTAIRSALLAAGFHVAAGTGSGPKAETTIALTRPDQVPHFSRHRLLGLEWLERRRRSSARFGPDVPPEHHDTVEARIVGHAQFRDAP